MTDRASVLELYRAINAAAGHATALDKVLTRGGDHLRPRAHVGADVLAQIEHVAAVQRAEDDPVARYSRDLYRDLAYARDLAAEVARRVPTAYRLVVGLEGDLTSARRLCGDPARLDALLRCITEDKIRARELVALLPPDGTVPGDGPPSEAGDARGSAARTRRGTRRRQPPPGLLCRRLVAGAVRVLPAQHQERYAREYAAELWELGAQHGRRRRRFAYALRLGASCLALRRALTAQGQEV